MYFIETSARECENVDKLFYEIARELIQVMNNTPIDNLLNEYHAITIVIMLSFFH